MAKRRRRRQPSRNDLIPRKGIETILFKSCMSLQVCRNDLIPRKGIETLEHYNCALEDLVATT